MLKYIKLLFALLCAFYGVVPANAEWNGSYDLKQCTYSACFYYRNVGTPLDPYYVLMHVEEIEYLGGKQQY